MDDAEEVARARAFIDRIVERALLMDGTCTGEHAIGQGKMRFLEPEHGRAAVEAMRAIKLALPSKGLLIRGPENPDPRRRGCERAAAPWERRSSHWRRRPAFQSGRPAARLAATFG